MERDYGDPRACAIISGLIVANRGEAPSVQNKKPAARVEKLERDYGDPRALWRVYLYEFAAQTSRENRFGAFFAEGLSTALCGADP